MLDIVQEDMTLEDDSRDPFYEISTNLEEFTTFPKMFYQFILFLFFLWRLISIMCGWGEHSQLCNQRATILNMVNFKFSIGDFAKGKKYQISNIPKDLGLVSRSAIRFPQKECGQNVAPCCNSTQLGKTKMILLLCKQEKMRRNTPKKHEILHNKLLQLTTIGKT